MTSDDNTPTESAAEDQAFDLGGLDDGVFDFEMPDIPMPEEGISDAAIEDTFKGAFKFSFLGIGRGGSRIVEYFYRLGYRRACVVNTAKQDLDKINVPDKNKLWLGAGGAGGERRIGAYHVREHYEDIVDKMRECYGSEFDRIMICVAAGGGTGSGGLEIAVDLANALVEQLRIKKIDDPTRVGLMIALPQNSERSNMSNSYHAMRFVERKLKSKELSPVIIIDNERVAQMFPSATVDNIWDRINQMGASLMHMFNVISVAPTKHIALDPEDLSNVLDSGVVTYGAMPIQNIDSPNSIGKTITGNLTKNVLCGGADMKNAASAGCILAGPADVIGMLNNKNIEDGFEKLERVTGNAKVHRGIYTTNKPLSAYTIVGGIGLPIDRLNEIARLAGREEWSE